MGRILEGKELENTLIAYVPPPKPSTDKPSKKRSRKKSGQPDAPDAGDRT
ncbi:MAG: hypothetical protein QN193_10290 [Armatimonadota bacterium]|nr:hypothetical protein [Armatimonadota bacterium]